MDDSNKSLAEKAMAVNPFYFYSGVGSLALIVLICFYWGGREPEKGSGEPQTPVALGELPDSLAETFDVIDWATKNQDPSTLIDGEMGNVLKDLESFCDASVAQKAPLVPLWLDRNFKGQGIDSDRLQERFQSDSFTVRRWQAGDTAPTFDGLSGFARFIESLTHLHAGSSKFQIKFKAYSAESIDGRELKIRLVAESSASRECNYEQMLKHGFRMHVTQATSILETTWLRTIAESDNTPRYALGKAKVLASEQIVALMNSGQLFADFTGAVLGSTPASEQFRYGLDQWSMQVPGIDIMGHQGVAIGDANGDGMEDLYVCQCHGLPNRLLIQKPNGSVRDTSQESQTHLLDASTAALFIDIDNDGDQDLVVATEEVLVVLSNDGGGVFQVERKVAVGGGARSLAGADYDNDGDLDLFLCKYQDLNRQSDILMFPADVNNPVDGGRNVLLRNDEGFEFSDVTDLVGLDENNDRFSRSCVWLDHDGDGDQDLYVANEFSSDQLWENRDGKFSDVSRANNSYEIARHTSVSVADFNADGREDLFVATDVPLSSLRVLNRFSSNESVGENQKSSEALARQLTSESLVRYRIEDDSYQSYFLRAPIFNNEAAQSSAVVDFNNDGVEDLVVANGGLTRISQKDRSEHFFSMVFSKNAEVPWPETGHEHNVNYRIARSGHEISDLCRGGQSFASSQRNRCYLNLKSGFANVSGLSGFDLPDDARSISVVDWDLDGDQDLIVSCRNAPQLRFLANQLDEKDTSVSFLLTGTQSNRDAIGARLELYVEGMDGPLMRTVRAGSGAMSQSSKRIHFGLPKRSSLSKLVVHWPSGKIQSFERVRLGVDYLINEGKEELAETVQERFGLSLRKRALDPLFTLPRETRRKLFYPRVPMLPLQVQTELGQWDELPIGDRPVLLVFWNRSGASDAWLEKVKLETSSLNTEDVKLFGVFCDVDRDTDAVSQFQFAKSTVESIEIPFEWGTLSPASADQLRYLLGDWFNHRHLPTQPFALLINAKRQVCASYNSSSIDQKVVHRDVRFCDRDALVYRSVDQQDGVWVADSKSLKLNRLRTRLKEVGYPAAAEFLDNVSNGQRADELTRKALEMESQGKFALAQKFFQNARKIDFRHAPAYIGEGELLIRASREQPNEDGTKYKLLNEAKEIFELVLSMYPASTDATMGLARVAIEQDRRRDALEMLLSLLEVAPKNYEVHALVGRLYFRQKKYHKSAKHLVFAFDHRPNLPHLAADLGFLYLVSKEDLLARKFLRLAHRLQPSDNNILRLLAESELVTGNLEEATKLFQEVTKKNPSHRRANNVLAWLLATCPFESQRDGEQAMNLIVPVAEILGDSSPSTLEIYAASTAESGDFKRAVELQRKAIDLILTETADEAYSESQRQGMRERLQLYQRNRPYRTADLSEIPLDRPTRIE